MTSRVKVCKVRESLRLDAALVDELTLQYGDVRERGGGFNARLQTAVNLSVD